MMDVLERIKDSIPVWEFLPCEVPWKHLEPILDEARCAATEENAQPWKFLVVRDEEYKAKLREAIREFLRAGIDEMTPAREEKRERGEGLNEFVGQILTAPALIFLLVYASRYPDFAAHDGAPAL